MLKLSIIVDKIIINAERTEGHEDTDAWVGITTS